MADRGTSCCAALRGRCLKTFSDEVRRALAAVEDPPEFVQRLSKDKDKLM